MSRDGSRASYYFYYDFKYRTRVGDPFHVHAADFMPSTPQVPGIHDYKCKSSSSLLSNKLRERESC